MKLPGPNDFGVVPALARMNAMGGKDPVHIRFVSADHDGGHHNTGRISCRCGIWPFFLHDCNCETGDVVDASSFVRGSDAHRCHVRINWLRYFDARWKP